MVFRKRVLSPSGITRSAVLFVLVAAAIGLSVACTDTSSTISIPSPGPTPAPVTTGAPPAATSPGPAPAKTPPPPPFTPASAAQVLGVRRASAAGQFEANYSDRGWQPLVNPETRTGPAEQEVFAGGLWWALTSPTSAPVAASPSPAPPAPPPPPAPPAPAPITPAAPVDPKLQELRLYLLSLINADRAQNGGLPPVALGTNTAAQSHVDDMLKGKFTSHWGTDGMKPYMRFTLAGGVNYDGENVASRDLTGGTGRLQFTSPSMDELKKIVAGLEQGLMNSPGHRRNILTPYHKKVNLGIAWDNVVNMRIDQQFEGDYVTFSVPPKLNGSMLQMGGRTTLGVVDSIAVYYDPLPQPTTTDQLHNAPYNSSYTIGLPEDEGAKILPPPPPGAQYIGLDQNDVVASAFNIGDDGSFTVLTDISPILRKGSGVYTLLVWATTSGQTGPGQPVAVTRYSLFVR